MNSLDKGILSILQEDATLSVAQIAERVGLSTSPCWRRIQNLEQNGIIRRRVALVDRQALSVYARDTIALNGYKILRSRCPASRKSLSFIA